MIASRHDGGVFTSVRVYASDAPVVQMHEGKSWLPRVPHRAAVRIARGHLHFGPAGDVVHPDVRPSNFLTFLTANGDASPIGGQLQTDDRRLRLADWGPHGAVPIDPRELLQSSEILPVCDCAVTGHRGTNTVVDNSEWLAPQSVRGEIEGQGPSRALKSRIRRVRPSR